MMRNHRDRFESERLRHELMGMGVGKDSPLASLTPRRAIMIMGAIVGFLALLVLISGGSGLFSGEGYADNIRLLSTDLRQGETALAPERTACLAGDSASCASHHINAGGQADRVGDQLTDIFGFDLPPEAANLNADYTLLLQDLEQSYRAEANALGNENTAEFAVAAEGTAAVLEREAVLIAQLNRDFPPAPAATPASDP